MSQSLSTARSTDLLEGPIFSCLAKLALPLMATAFLGMAYSMTDMIWIGRLGKGPAAAVGTVGTLLWLSEGVLTLFRVGTQILTAEKIGAKAYDEVKEIVSAGIQLNIFSALLVGTLFMVFREPMMSFFRLTPATHQHALEYFVIMLLGLPGSYAGRLLSAISTAAGDSKMPFITNGLGLILNIVLDPIFIFVFGWEVKGAAIASILAEYFVLIILVWAVLKKPVFHGLPTFKRLYSEHYGRIFRLGVSPALQSTFYCFFSIILTRLASTFGESVISAQKIGANIESISWMTADGFALALTAFMAQNYGAKQIERSLQGYKVALRLVLVFGAVTTSLLYFFAGPIYHLFLPDPTALADGKSYLQVLALSQTFMSLEIIVTAAFNAFGRTFYPAAVVTLCAASRIPIAFTLSKKIGSAGIWWALTLSSIAMGLILVPSFAIFRRSILRREGLSHKK